VFDEALSLPAEARVSLVERLLTSLNLPTQAEIDRLWAEEAEERIAQIDKGEKSLFQGIMFSLISARTIGDEILFPPRCRPLG
jgi:hypothetical protein